MVILWELNRFVRAGRRCLDHNAEGRLRSDWRHFSFRAYRCRRRRAGALREPRAQRRAATTDSLPIGERFGRAGLGPRVWVLKGVGFLPSALASREAK